MQKVVVIESGFLRTNKKAKGRVVLCADDKKIWMQVEDKRSDLEDATVLHEEAICDIKEVFGVHRKPSSDTFSSEPLHEIELIRKDGTSQSLGSFPTGLAKKVENLAGETTVIEFCTVPTKPEVSFFDSASLNDDGAGIVRFALTSTNLLVSFGESAEIASAGFEQNDKGRFVRILPLEPSMTFEFDDFDGIYRTEVQKRARLAATAVLFPVFGLATVLIPSKKVSVTTDTRTFELRMAGKGWQLLLVFPISHLGYVMRLRQAMQEELVSKDPKTKGSNQSEAEGSKSNSIVEELGNAAKLMESGLISREEFDAIKAKLMG